MAATATPSHSRGFGAVYVLRNAKSVTAVKNKAGSTGSPEDHQDAGTTSVRENANGATRVTVHHRSVRARLATSCHSTTVVPVTNTSRMARAAEWLRGAIVWTTYVRSLL